MIRLLLAATIVVSILLFASQVEFRLPRLALALPTLTEPLLLSPRII